MGTLTLMTILLTSSPAHATVDPACDQLEKPANYNEQVQRDFLSNYTALGTTLSAQHAPIPHKAGHGAIGLDLAVIPPLGCGQRMVEDWGKTEDTNKAPVVPRPRATFTFQPIAQLIYPYAGLAVIPPIWIGNHDTGTYNLFLSAEVGAGMYLGKRLELGARYHATAQRTFGNVALAPVEGDPEKDDLYVASSTGADLQAGWELLQGGDDKPTITPYVSVGFTEVTTFFWIGDDGVVPNNEHPYQGMDFSVGVDTLTLKHLRAGGEFYAAPGGHSQPNPNASTVDEGAFSRYGNIYTVRLKVAYEL